MFECEKISFAFLSKAATGDQKWWRRETKES